MSYRYIKVPEEASCYLVFEKSARGFYLGRVEKQANASNWHFTQGGYHEPTGWGMSRWAAVKHGMENLK